LKGYRCIRRKPRETQTVTFRLSDNKIAFYNQSMQLTAEPGEFRA
jgi:hypothetical protein